MARDLENERGPAYHSLTGCHPKRCTVQGAKNHSVLTAGFHGHSYQLHGLVGGRVVDHTSMSHGGEYLFFLILI